MTLGEPIEHTVTIDIDAIVRDQCDEVQVRSRTVSAEAHHTEIVLCGLHNPPQGQVLKKIGEHSRAFTVSSSEAGI